MLFARSFHKHYTTFLAQYVLQMISHFTLSLVPLPQVDSAFAQEVALVQSSIEKVSDTRSVVNVVASTISFKGFSNERESDRWSS